MRYKRTRTDAALPQPHSPHFVMFTGSPKAPASLGDVHRTRKGPQTPPDIRTQRPHPSSILARQSVSAQSASHLSRAHSLAAIGGAASAKRESPGFLRTASLIATSTHPSSHPQLQCPGAFLGAQPKPRHFSWNFTPETRRLPLKGTQNRASTPATAHAGLLHKRPLPSPHRDGYFSPRRDKRTSSSSRAFSPARSAQRNGACQGLE